MSGSNCFYASSSYVNNSYPQISIRAQPGILFLQELITLRAVEDVNEVPRNDEKRPGLMLEKGGFQSLYFASFWDLAFLGVLTFYLLFCPFNIKKTKILLIITQNFLHFLPS